MLGVHARRREEESLTAHRVDEHLAEHETLGAASLVVGRGGRRIRVRRPRQSEPVLPEVDDEPRRLHDGKAPLAPAPHARLQLPIARGIRRREDPAQGRPRDAGPGGHLHVAPAARLDLAKRAVVGHVGHQVSPVHLESPPAAGREVLLVLEPCPAEVIPLRRPERLELPDQARRAEQATVGSKELPHRAGGRPALYRSRERTSNRRGHSSLIVPGNLQRGIGTSEPFEKLPLNAGQILHRDFLLEPRGRGRGSPECRGGLQSSQEAARPLD